MSTLGSQGINFINILLNHFLFKVRSAAFFKLQFGFVNFWQKNICAKAAPKMLMKLTKGVNFINILHTIFLYESLFSSYILALNGLSYKKHAHKTLMKLTTGG